MIEEIKKLYCDHCSNFIAKINNEREKRDYVHAEGYEKDNVEFIRFNVFCSKKCKEQFYKDLNASKIIDWL